MARCEQNLASRNCHALQDQAGCGLPKPIADLIVEGDVFLRRVDVDVIPQTIQELRSIGLRIDRVHSDMLSKNPTLRALGLGVDVYAFVRLPNTRQMTQGSEISQAVGGYVVGLGKDVGGHGQHTKTSCDRGIGDLMLTDSVESPRSYDRYGVPFKFCVLTSPVEVAVCPPRCVQRSIAKQRSL